MMPTNHDEAQPGAAAAAPDTPRPARQEPESERQAADLLDELVQEPEEPEEAVGAEPQDEGLEPRGAVFISYRVEPDHSVAVAVRRLLQASITPPPEVFVSGESLRPSALGYKPQIQHAAQQAQAFIGIITPESKSREWIFFEAGAAWGRGQTYAPLLVDASPADLGSTIADYQATSASDKAAVQRLVQGIADDLGAALKPRFSQRYAAFERALEARRAPRPDASQMNVMPERREFSKALDLLFKGERGAAETILAALLERLPETDPLRCEVAVARVAYGHDRSPRERLEGLERLESPTRESRVWHYWMASYEEVPSCAVEHLRACVAAPGDANDPWYRFAVLDLVTHLIAAGERAAALSVVSEALASSARQLRCDVSERFASNWASEHPLLRLLVLSYGIASAPDASSLDAAANLALEQGWPALAVHYASAHSSAKGGEHLTLGRVLHSHKFPSSAYAAYKRDIDSSANSASAAKANLASLLAEQAVPAHAQDVIRGHLGEFNTRDPAFAHRVRASIESKIYDESEKVSALEKLGRQVAGLLASTAHDALGRGCRRASKLNPSYQAGGVTITVVPGSENQYAYTASDGASGVVFCPNAEFPLFVMEQGGAPSETPRTILGQAAAQDAKKLTAVLAQRPDGSLRGFTWEFGGQAATPMPVMLIVHGDPPSTSE